MRHPLSHPISCQETAVIQGSEYSHSCKKENVILIVRLFYVFLQDYSHPPTGIHTPSESIHTFPFLAGGGLSTESSTFPSSSDPTCSATPGRNNPCFSDDGSVNVCCSGPCGRKTKQGLPTCSGEFGLSHFETFSLSFPFSYVTAASPPEMFSSLCPFGWTDHVGAAMAYLILSCMQ
jgi:hypothetical protein